MAEILCQNFLHSNMATSRERHSSLYVMCSIYVHFGQEFISKIHIIILLKKKYVYILRNVVVINV